LDFGIWILAIAAVAVVAQDVPRGNPKSKIQNLKWESNSRAESARAMQQYAQGDYAAAARSFSDAASSAPSPLRDFNRGTAQIASGARAEGSAALTRALRDPQLRGAALFNRGNASLASDAFDNAIRDYRDALRFNAGDAGAKRNLEIALIRKKAKEQSSAGARGQNRQPEGKNNQQPQPSAGNGQQSPEAGEANIDALLRSVQQQEQEELERMRQSRAKSVHVGW
jgi:hypothetical protein